MEWDGQCGGARAMLGLVRDAQIEACSRRCDAHVLDEHVGWRKCRAISVRAQCAVAVAPSAQAAHIGPCKPRLVHAASRNAHTVEGEHMAASCETHVIKRDHGEGVGRLAFERRR
jgi:hypothetical protein